MAEWRNRIIEQRTVTVAELRANPSNWRKHPAAQAKAIRGLLSEVGIVAPLIAYYSPRANGSLTLIDGHMRHETGGEWPVTILDVTDEEADLILATFDPITGMAEMDAQALAGLLGRVEMTPVVDDGLAALLTSLGEESGKDAGANTDVDAAPQVDKAEELRVKWGVQAGQLWQLGDHRLICGDCTDADVVARVMGGEKADCTVADPPYGVGVDYGGFDDTAANVKTLIDGFMPIAQGMGPMALTPGVPAMWNYPRPAWVGAWVHPASTSSGPWGFIGANPILYYGKDPYLSAGKGRRDSSFVMVADRKGEDDHPVSKPLNVWVWLVERMTPNSGAIVYEPFSGSGTTIIACEQLGRKCRAIEISPAYVAVALQRWADATGREPQLISAP